jgi:hypothetical protein
MRVRPHRVVAKMRMIKICQLQSRAAQAHLRYLYAICAAEGITFDSESQISAVYCGHLTRHRMPLYPQHPGLVALRPLRRPARAGQRVVRARTERALFMSLHGIAAT